MKNGITLLLIVCSIQFCAVPTYAQETPSEQDRLAQLEAKIAALEARLKTLESQLLILTATPTPTPKPPEDIPEDIDQIIRDQAAIKYPDANSTQLYVIKQERKAWKEVQTYTADIPDEILQQIKQKAATRFQHKYSTQLYVIKQEVEAYQELHPQ